MADTAVAAAGNLVCDAGAEEAAAEDRAAAVAGRGALAGFARSGVAAGASGAAVALAGRPVVTVLLGAAAGLRSGCGGAVPASILCHRKQRAVSDGR